MQRKSALLQESTEDRPIILILAHRNFAKHLCSDLLEIREDGERHRADPNRLDEVDGRAVEMMYGDLDEVTGYMRAAGDENLEVEGAYSQSKAVPNMAQNNIRVCEKRTSMTFSFNSFPLPSAQNIASMWPYRVRK